ncbi:hypothetical protein BZZ01_19660 [Nostocales cyanobacterium HT-58-2]|nr:hypothetical protein BZZ01_19660 [Nostocales cyanobacterium HT-58-2]
MSEFARNLAFVIGINNYDNGIPPLNNAVNDAKKLVEILRESHGYQVWVCLDKIATLKNLLHLLETTLPQQVRSDDRLLFYFAGHGIALNGEDGPAGYLIPQDAKQGNTQSYLPMTKLQECLSEFPCRHFLGILDCCFAGAFRWSSTRDLLSAPEVLHQERYERFIQDPAWQVITSAAYDQKATDAFNLNTSRGRVGGHSPFAAALLEALAGGADIYPPAEKGKPPGDGVITATELYLYLRDRVERATVSNIRRQTPGIWPLKKHDKGEYIFLTPGHQLNLPPAPPLDESQNPYQGLQSFDEEDTHLFFGRQALTEKLYEFVSKRSLTMVLGASGTGKSSLVKAGLIPYLKQLQKNSNQQQWHILATIRPGESPLKALNNALISANLAATSITRLTTEQKVESLFGSLSTWSQNNPQSKLLLVIDQLEELITLCRDDQERENFLELLAQAIANYSEQLRIVLTLRSDFEPQFRNSALELYWTSARFIVPAMTREELRSCIEEPASARVMYFEPHNLVDKLIDEVVQMPGALPLLSFTLSELYLKYLRAVREGTRDNRAITQQDYEELGGVTRSLTQRADSEYEKLVQQDKAYAQVIRNVMLRMVAVGGGELARRRVPLSELEYPEPENQRVIEVIQRFTAARLLVEGQDTEGKPYVEPAHDALVRGWQKLLTWKQDDEESLILQRRLTSAAQEWRSKEQSLDHQGKVDVFLDWLDQRFYSVENLFNKVKTEFVQLWRQTANQQKRPKEKPAQFLWNANPYLDVLNEKLNSSNDWFNQLEAEFVQHSVRQKRKNVAWRWRIAFGVMLGLSGLLFWSLVSQREAEIEQTRAARESSETKLQSNQPILDALVLSLQAGKSLKHPLLQLLKPEEQDQIQVTRTLRKAFYTVREQNSLKVDTGQVENVFWKEGKLLLATAENNGTVRVLNKNSQVLATVKLPQGLVTKLVFSPDTSRLAIARNDGIITLWDWEQKRQTEFRAHQAPIKSVAFSPDGRRLASVAKDGVARLWDASGNNLQEFNEAQSRVIGVSFDPNGQLLRVTISKDNRIVCLWDSVGKELGKFTPPAPVDEAIISPDGRRVVIIYASATDRVSSQLWNWENNYFWPLGKDIIVSFSRDGKHLATTGFDDGTVRLRDWFGKQEEPGFKGHQSQITSINFKSDGTVLVTGSADGNVNVWNVLSPQLSIFKQLPVLVTSVDFDKDGKQLVTLGKDGVVRLLDLSGKELKAFKKQYDPQGQVSFSPNGKQLAILDKGTIRLLDLLGNQLTEFPGQYASASQLRFSPDDEQLAFIENDNVVCVLNLLSKQENKFYIGGNDPLKSIIWRTDDKQPQLLVATIGNSASGEKSIRMWDLLSSQQVATPLQDYLRDFTNIHFNNDGSIAAIAKKDGSLDYWYLEGSKLGELKWGEGNIKSVSFSSSGDIAIVGENGIAKLSRLGALDELLSMGCDRVRDYLTNNFMSDSPSVASPQEDRHLCDYIDTGK